MEEQYLLLLEDGTQTITMPEAHDYASDQDDENESKSKKLQ